MIDITRNAVWTPDCCGKEDLDFNIISADTRYWPDNSAKCTIFFVEGNFYSNLEYKWNEPYNGVVLVESDYIRGSDKDDCQKKVREWYNEHVREALIKALELIKED